MNRRTKLIVKQIILASDSPCGIPKGESEVNQYLIFPVFPDFDLNQGASTFAVFIIRNTDIAFTVYRFR